MSLAHTQGTLVIAEETGLCVVAVAGDGGREICECFADGETQTPEDEANAQHIVKTWNAFPKLVDVLHSFVGTSTATPAQRIERAVALLRELGELP